MTPTARAFIHASLLLLPFAAAHGDARAQARPEPVHPGVPPGDALYEELARMDSVFFDVLFAECDAERADGMVTADVEFYDDRTGLTKGDEVRAGFRRMTGNCPAGNGVRRILLEKSVEVYPIEGFGAMQRGIHHFVERGATHSTIARFVHLWTNADGAWRLARIVSVDHRSVDAADAAALREPAEAGVSPPSR